MSDQVERGSAALAAEGWRKVTLGEIYDIGSSKRVLQKQWKTFGVPFYRAREIVKLARNGFVDNDLFISEDHFAELEKAKGVPKPGDLMVSAVGTLGACYAVQPGDRFYFKDASVLSFRPIAQIESRFMQYAFLSDDLLAKVKSGEGATVGTFTIARAKATEFLLPPLDEQKRIVAVLDQAFAALDRARAHAEANLADAERLAETFLDDQIGSLTNAFGRIRVDAVAEIKGGKRLLKGVKPEAERTPYPYIMVRDMDGAGSVTADTVGFISETAQHSIHRYTISCADVYISIAGTIGKTGVVPKGLDGANLTENAAKLVLADGWLRDFVYWSTRSTDFREQTAEQTRVAAQPKLALQRLGCITIPNADRKSQAVLVEKLVRFRDGITAAKSSYREKLTELANLRQSLLQKAFSGQLT